jgi:polygalacturonase
MKINWPSTCARSVANFGRGVTGTIQLKDNITLRLDENAVLPGSTNAGVYRNVDPFIDGVGAEMGCAPIVATRAAARGAILNGSNFFAAARGSTARSVANPLWTLKPNSTKPCLMRHPNAVNRIEARPDGVTNGTHYVLTSTNIALPLTNWTRLVTNQFDGSGNFNFTNAMNPNSPQSFYLLQLP